MGALRASGELPADALWVSSTELKAVSTAKLLTSSDIGLDAELREAVRDPAWLSFDDFQATVLRSFAQPDTSVREGWEPLEVTRRRVTASARSAVERGAGRDVVLVGHGTAWTMLIAGLTGQPPDLEAWQAMQMPDHCALEWPHRIAQPWGSWSA